MFEDEPSITGKDILAGASSSTSPSKSTNADKKRGRPGPATHAPVTSVARSSITFPFPSGKGFGIGHHPKAAAAWQAVRATTAKAFLPSLATAAAGAAVTTLHRRYGGRVVRLLSDQRDRARLRREKARLEREIRKEQKRYESEMRSMMEDAAAAQQQMEGEGEEDGVEVFDGEGEAEEGGVDAAGEQQEQQRPPGLDMRAYVSQLEEKVAALKAEVTSRGEQVCCVIW